MTFLLLLSPSLHIHPRRNAYPVNLAFQFQSAAIADLLEIKKNRIYIFLPAVGLPDIFHCSTSLAASEDEGVDPFQLGIFFFCEVIGGQ